MPELTEYSATIEVEGAEYEFDRPHIEADDEGGNMALNLFLTCDLPQVQEMLAETLAENDFSVKSASINDDFIAVRTETRPEMDYEALENVMRDVVNVTEYPPDWWQICAAESPWGANVAFITLW